LNKYNIAESLEIAGRAGLSERRSLDVVVVKEHRDLEVARSWKRIVDIIDAIAEVISIDEFGCNRAMGSFDVDMEGLASDSLEVVGLRLGADGEGELLDEGVLVGSAFLDVDGVGALSDGVVLEVDIDGVLASIDWGVGDVVGAIVVVDHFGRNISSWSHNLYFERIASFSHIVSIPVTSLDMEGGGLGIEDFAFDTWSPDQ